MEQVKNKSRYALGTNYTMPGSGNWKNFNVDRKNAKAVYTKYTRFAAKRDLEMGIITQVVYDNIMRELNFKKK